MNELICVGPLRLAKKFVLVGDHHQLSPIAKSEKSKELGIDISLFQRLYELHPEGVAALSLQYRMNADILRLPNSLFYQNRLKSGSKKISEAELNFPKRNISFKIPSQEWLRRAIEPKEKLLFLNTDNLRIKTENNGSETHQGNRRIINETEVKIIIQVLKTYQANGMDFKTSSFGVLSTYRSQAIEMAIKVETDKAEVKDLQQLEVSTIDKFQGRDCDCILLSLVRSNNHNAIGALLTDWCRMNVALTRAKKKLLIVGSRKTLKTFKFLGEMLRLLHEWDCVAEIDTIE